jgi:ATP-dependent DNA helicase PIF1
MTQKTALSILKLGHTTFLTGAAGAGKSYVLREYIKYLKEHKVNYAVTASTGIASTHINGQTIHAWSGIGIKSHLTAYDLDALEEKQSLYKKWNSTSVLIIDEVSMLHASFIDMLNTLGKHMRRSDKPFGGLQVIFTGDFFQLPPVTRGVVDGDIFAFTSAAWKEARPVICYLTEQFRQDDDALTSLLNAIRSGDIEEDHYTLLESRTKTPHKDDHIKLYTHNENVDSINEEAFQKLKGEIRSFHMTTKGKASIVETLKKNCLAPEVLNLKIGAKVICIKNAQDRSYVNGSMGEVTSFDKDGSPVVILLNGKRVTILPDSWKIEEEGKVRAELQQLPLRLAWAITVHKSQGMTIDKAEIDLSRAFASGQGYVALSRLTSLDGLYLKGFTKQALHIIERVREEDILFRKKSDNAEDALTKYSSEELERLHVSMLKEWGGSVEAVAIDDDLSDDEVKTPSHMLTKTLLDEGKTIQEIAELRSISEDTVIGHIEKLKEYKEDVSLEHLLPKKKEFDTIASTFEKLDTRKLTPVFEALKGKVSYHTLRIVRVYLNL